MRLAKYLAHAGVASRRAAEKLVSAGRVTVGGEVVRDPARDVDDARRGRGRRQADRRPAGPRVVYLVNKPAGVVSTAHDTHGRRTIVDLVRATGASTRSAASTPTRPGLILLTNDGELAYRLTHPSFEVPRTYRARSCATRPCASRRCGALREGVELEDGLTAPAKVRRISSERARADHPRGPQAPGPADVRGASATGSRRSSASRSARCGSARCRPAGTGASPRPRSSGCAKPPAVAAARAAD